MQIGSHLHTNCTIGLLLSEQGRIIFFLVYSRVGYGNLEGGVRANKFLWNQQDGGCGGGYNLYRIYFSKGNARKRGNWHQVTTTYFDLRPRLYGAFGNLGR